MDKITVHEKLCFAMHELYKKKNADYGDSFAQMRKRYPEVIGMKLWEKINRLCTLLEPGYAQKVSDEGIADTLMDIANYSIMELTERAMDKMDKEEQ